ncbi:hypothetical protein RFI_20608 [Reticulomyxa filosa]|uniref:Uncharacterized protein n=1 Tax=Reticulomyxa filosa TaxID=46433 RepID=X6MSS6_RETFI|nr:hypothetical protein RFI_20608 [Reticulomyxa filosa]|eukprot:ETO16731.1 hypothetical protein RFI_20608 [Reticulomyxa filosa]
MQEESMSEKVRENINNNQENEQEKYSRELKVLVRLCGDVIKEEELKKQLEETNGNVSMVIDKMVSKLLDQTVIFVYTIMKQPKEESCGKIEKIKKVHIYIFLNIPYEETLDNYPNLQKMVEEPFLLQLILSVLPSLVKQYGTDSKISRAQVYEVFNEQWIDIHTQSIASKLADLRIQMNISKVKSVLKQYCLDLGFEMFLQGNQVALEPAFQSERNDESWSKLDPKLEQGNKEEEKSMSADDGMGTMRMKGIMETVGTMGTMGMMIMNASGTLTYGQETWGKYFNGDSIAKYVLRRVGENRYQFLHKSCQEYYATQKIVLDIIAWRPDTYFDLDNRQFQQQFEMQAPKLVINRKLLNRELLKVFEGHSKLVNGAQILLDNSMIISWSDDATIRIWDIESGKELKNFDKHSGGVNRVHLIRYDSQMASCSRDGTIRIWNTSNERVANKIDVDMFEVTGVQLFTDYSKALTFTNGNIIQFWNLFKKELQRPEGHTDSVLNIRFSPDTLKLISCSKDKTFRIWDASF